MPEACGADGRIWHVAIRLNKTGWAIPRWEVVHLDEGVRVEEWEIYRKSLMGLTASECTRRWGERFERWCEHGLKIDRVLNWTNGWAMVHRKENRRGS